MDALLPLLLLRLCVCNVLLLQDKKAGCVSWSHAAQDAPLGATECASRCHEAQHGAIGMDWATFIIETCVESMPR